MPYQVVDLGNITVTSSGNPVNTVGVGHLDDATNVTIFVTSSGNWSSTSAAGVTVQVSQFDPFDTVFSTQFVAQSTAWFQLVNTTGGNVIVTSSGLALTINDISFRGIRLTNLSSAGTDIVGRITKQITV